MNMKKFGQFFIILLVALSLLACDKSGTDQTVEAQNKNVVQENAGQTMKKNASEEENAKEASNLIEDKEAQGEKLEGSLYFPSKDYIATGDEGNKYIQVPVTLEASSKEDLAKEAQALLEKEPGDDQGENFVKPGQIKSISLKDRIAYVDLAKDQFTSGGSLDEEVFLGQVVKTLTSFKDVEGVQFLVDGQEAESLLGHYDLSQVFTDFE